MRREFYYPSADKKTTIHAMEWKPEGQVRGILQICHGMVEYIGRYDEFAAWISKKGYYVVGNDHLGHGESVCAPDCYGYFPEDKGNECVIGDIRKLHCITKKKYPDLPYFMLGHSMGSFLLRQYIQTYGKEIQGAIIMGTGFQPVPLLRTGMLVCRILAWKYGWKYRSKIVDAMAFGGYNKRFEPGKTGKEWLSKNEKNVDAYVCDERCMFLFTLSGYYQMFRGMKTLTDKRIKKIPKTLPVLFLSGKEDPVGAFGKGVETVYKQYQKAGIRDVQIRLYEGLRHEILNETERIHVYEEVYQWMDIHRHHKN